MRFKDDYHNPLTMKLFSFLAFILLASCSDKEMYELRSGDVVFIFRDVSPEKENELRVLMERNTRVGDKLEVSTHMMNNDIAFDYTSGLSSEEEKEKKIALIEKALERIAGEKVELKRKESKRGPVSQALTPS